MPLVKKCLLFTLFLFIAQFVEAQNKKYPTDLIERLRAQALEKPAAADSEITIYITKALADKDSFMYAKLLDTKGIAKRNMGNYAEAIESHKKAYDIFNLMGNKNGTAGCLNSLAIMMIRTGKFEEATKYGLAALKDVNMKDSSLVTAIYINLGVGYDYSDQTQLAIETYKKALPYAATQKDPDYSLGCIHHDIAVCYSMLEDYKKATEYEMIAWDYQRKCGNKDLLARIGISMGSNYLDQGLTDKAMYYYEIGKKAAEEINSVELLEEYYNHIIELYITRKDSKNALESIMQLNLLRKKQYSDENAKNIAEAETKFNVSIKNKEIENLKINKNLAELKAERSTLLRNVMIGVVLVAMALIGVLFGNYSLRKKNLVLLAREKQLVESEKKALEKNNELLQNENMLARFEILKSQVSPHFLFNTLNALSYLIETDSDKAVQFTNAFSKLYRTILELKDQNLITLEQELGHVQSYFFLQLTRFGNSLKIDKNIPPEYNNLKLPPFGIQLAVENAINHNIVSDDRPLCIKIYCEDNFLTIENNLQLKTKTVKSTSMGIANIKSRYSFFTDINPEFNKTETSFIVKLPLLNEA